MTVRRRVAVRGPTVETFRTLEPIPTLYSFRRTRFASEVGRNCHRSRDHSSTWMRDCPSDTVVPRMDVA